MKNILYFFCFCFTACNSVQNEEKIIESVSQEIDKTTQLNEPSYDSTLAAKLQADDYGMKPYVLALLKTGPNAPKDSLHAIELQKAHMANINRLAEEGKLVVAGPFYGSSKGNYRGIYIFDTANLDSAKAYTESDPAIEYGSLQMELINYYGSAALMQVNEIHQKIAKVEI